MIAGLNVVLFGAAHAQAQVQPKRPNIVVILGDDLGFADLGSFGGERTAIGPEDMRVAAQMMVMRAHHGDVIFTVGAGDITDMGPVMLHALEAHREGCE